ncbi:MAG: hypothetical protein M1815_005577 [Lichina confinis]|nr:MAG: hypothetical protein M1815_005577 [Lichina confinis]
MSGVLSSRVLGAAAARQLALSAGSRRAATGTTAAAAVDGARGFQSSGPKAALKETRDMDKEDVKEEIEHHKQDQLNKTLDGKNHWTEELASESESIVKADRTEGNSTADDISQLQKHTTEKLNSKSKGETMDK